MTANLLLSIGYSCSKCDMQGLIKTGCFRYTLLFVCFSYNGKNCYLLYVRSGRSDPDSPFLSARKKLASAHAK